MGALSISPSISPNSSGRDSLRHPLPTEWLMSYNCFSARVAPVSDWATRRPVGPQTHWAIVTASPGGIQFFQDSTSLRGAKFSSICAPPGCAEGARFRGLRNMSNTEQHSFISPLHTEAQAATLLRHSLSTLRRWRRGGTGPTFLRFGRIILYRVEDLQIFIEAHRSRQGVS
jgi:hypothetical protein